MHFVVEPQVRLFFVEDDEATEKEFNRSRPLTNGVATHVLPGQYTILAVKTVGKDQLLSRTVVTITDAPEQTITVTPSWPPVTP
ncbi:MAG: hypothetical protein U0228_34910 [Myxococcaceae bacterium]